MVLRIMHRGQKLRDLQLLAVVICDFDGYKLSSTISSSVDDLVDLFASKNEPQVHGKKN